MGRKLFLVVSRVKGHQGQEEIGLGGVVVTNTLRDVKRLFSGRVKAVCV